VVNKLLLRIRETKSDTGKVTSSSLQELDYIRIQPINEQRQNGQGSQVFPSWKIFLNAEEDILSTDLLEYESVKYSILRIYKVRDIDNSIHHIEVSV